MADDPEHGTPSMQAPALGNQRGSQRQQPVVQPCLNVNLLKERMELELSLKREGLRFFLTLVFGFLFAYSHLLAFAPMNQYETGWLVKEKLGLSKTNKLASTREAYDALMETARSARIFYPLSSLYLEEGMAKTLIEGRRKFLNGQQLLPLDSRPTLPLEWSVYFRLRLEDWKNTKPKRLQLISDRIKSGGQDMTCWGFYAKGLYKYTLVYGGHNLEEGAVELDFQFDRETARTNPLGLSLIALTLNATHATVMLEDAGETEQIDGVEVSAILPGSVTHPLAFGTQPTDCRRGSYYLGEEGLELASMEFQPFQLTEATFRDIQEVGQPLSQLVIGTARPPSVPPDEQNSYQTEAHRHTQDLVRSGDDTLEAIVRLSGSIAMEGSEAVNSLASAEDEYDDADYEDVPFESPPALVTMHDNSTLPTPVMSVDLSAVLLGEQSDDPEPSSLSANLTSAFGDLWTAGLHNFTLTWWAFANLTPPPDTEQIRESISFVDVSSGAPRFTVDYVFGGNLPVYGGWIVRFNNAPICGSDTSSNTDTTRCMQSPAFWCQGADSGTHDGLWRHFALRFSADQSSKGAAGDDIRLWQRVDLLQDGTSVCGVLFSADEVLAPHGVQPSSQLRVDFVDRGRSVENSNYNDATDGSSAPGEDSAITVKEVHLYPEALSDNHMLALANDPQLQECLPLHLLTDNPNFTSSFGQSCADLAEQRSQSAGSDESSGTCGLFSAIRNCPVSCRDFERPLCFDGTLPKPIPGLSPFGNTTKSFLYEPFVRNNRFPGYGSDAYWAELIQRGSAQWTRKNDQREDWKELFRMVENLEYGTVITSTDLKGRTSLDPIWRVPAVSSDDLRCPGEELGVEVFADICSSEQSHQGIMDDLMALGRSGDDVNIAIDFPSGMMAAGSSYSMYMWARRTGTDAIHMIGADADNNLCFDFNSTHAVLMRNGLLSDGPVTDAEEALMAGFVPVELAQPKRKNNESSSNRVGGEWRFFALSVDTEKEEVLFAIDDQSTKLHLEGLGRGEWGCNDLRFIINVGGDVSISPINVRGSPITASGLQQLHLASRRTYRGMVGPRRSRRDRLTPRNRRREPFTVPVVGIVPPLLLQQREVSRLASFGGNGASQQCETDVAAGQVTGKLIRNRKRECRVVYECALSQAVRPSKCSESNGTAIGETADGIFYGRAPQQYKGRDVYPEFAWALDNEILVRDGKVLFPGDSYVDDRTTSVRVLTCLYNYDTQVASILEADYDLRGLEVRKTVSVHQVKLLTSGEYHVWKSLTIGTLMLAFLVLLLALPAAIEEGRAILTKLQRTHNRLATKINAFPSSRRWAISKFQITNPMGYTADTTQPDVLDVVFFLTITMLLIAELAIKSVTLEEVTNGFGDLAEKEWGVPGVAFAEEMDVFLTKVKRAEVRMESENVVKMMGFVALLMVGIRLLIFMKVHPRVATITRTFETVGTELLNFCFSFGIIFVFMALTAHLRFGSTMESFSTFRKALLTQFMVLLTVDLPAFGKDVFMTIYVVGYVVLCALSLLNFFLAIVVNGYTKVSEDVLENKVVNSIGKDVLLIFRDVWLWTTHRWLGKADTLNVLARAFPHIFENGYAQADTYKEELISREEYIDLFTTNSVALEAIRKQRSQERGNIFVRFLSWIGRGRKWVRIGGTSPGMDEKGVAKMAGEVFDHYLRQFEQTVLVAPRKSLDVNDKQTAVAETLHDPGLPSRWAS